MHILRIVVAVVLFGWVANLLGLAAPAASVVDNKDFSIFAHRGYWLGGPVENTKGAVRRAWSVGATAVEVDLRISSDGAIIIMHDETLNRTTGCTGYVHQKPVAAIRECRTDDGQVIPYAYGILEQAANLGLYVALEIKEDPLGRWTKDRFAQLGRAIDRAGMRERVMIISFDRAALRRAKAVLPDIETQWITTFRPTTRDALGIDGIALRYEDRDLATVFRSAGYQVQGRRVETVEEWEGFAKVGITEIVVDNVEAFRDWKHGLG